MPIQRYGDVKVYKYIYRYISISYKNSNKFFKKKLENLKKVKNFKNSKKL